MIIWLALVDFWIFWVDFLLISVKLTNKEC